MERSGPYAELQEGGHLVLHQRDQGRYHHGEAFTQQRGQLITQRLAAARGHQHQRITPVGHMLDDLCLMAAKRRVAEGLTQALESACDGIRKRWRHGRCHGRGAKDSQKRSACRVDGSRKNWSETPEKGFRAKIRLT